MIRIEMQSQIKRESGPSKLTIASAARYIYAQNGAKGFFRGIAPRVALGSWQTVCMVFGGDQVKERFGTK